MYYPETELITDGIAIIYAQPSMKPAILEAFGHLDGGIIRSGVFTARTYTSYATALQSLMELRDEKNKIELVDSKLEVVDGKDRFRILYEKETGEKAIINESYTAMIKGFDCCQLYACKDHGSEAVHVVKDKQVISLIMRTIPVEKSFKQLANSFDFKVKKEGCTCDK